LSDRGEAMGRLIDDARAHGDEHLTAAADALRAASDYILAAEREDGLAGASAYLALAGDVAGGMLLARGLKRAPGAEQQTLVNYYAATVLARAPSRLAEIKIGAAALSAAGFGD
jgi:hypothetical protein